MTKNKNKRLTRARAHTQRERGALHQEREGEFPKANKGTNLMQP